VTTGINIIAILHPKSKYEHAKAMRNPRNISPNPISHFLAQLGSLLSRPGASLSPLLLTLYMLPHTLLDAYTPNLKPCLGSYFLFKGPLVLRAADLTISKTTVKRNVEIDYELM
jgi:uncharacterized membrane protein